MSSKTKKLKYGIPPRKPTRKKKRSNILNTSMTSELKTELSRQGITPLEKLGINLMYDKKQTGAKGKVTPVRNLSGRTGRLGVYSPESGNILYSVGHEGMRPNLYEKGAKRQSYEELAGEQVNTLLHEGTHKAINEGIEILNRRPSAQEEHQIISTINVQKAGSEKESNTILKGNPRFKRNVSPAVFKETAKSGTRDFNFFSGNLLASSGAQRIRGLRTSPRDSGKWEESKARVKIYQDKASKALKMLGLEDPSTFKAKNTESAKDAKKENALTNMRRILQRQRNMLPMVTSRHTKFGT